MEKNAASSGRPDEHGDGRMGPLDATRAGRVHDVLLALKSGAFDADFEKEEDRTALLEAAKRGDSKLVELLLTIQAAADGREARTLIHSALCLAARSGELEVVRWLLEQEAVVDLSNQRGASVLNLAVQEGYVDIVELLLERGAALDGQDNGGSVEGRTALGTAAVYGQLEAARLLLDRGAAIDSQNEHGATPLIMAARQGKAEVVQLLLERGAAVNAQDREGGTPLLLASLFGRLSAARSLLEYGADVRLGYLDGFTCLMVAAQKGHAELVELLIEKHASVDTHAKNGETALALAAYSENREVVRVLLERGADVETGGCSGDMPLLIAAEAGHADTVQLLLDHNAPINYQDKDGDTALQLAAYKGYTDAARVILEHKGAAMVDLVNSGGWTPLMTAAQRGYSKLVTLLAEKNAALDWKLEDGRTALSFAAEETHLETVRVLIEHGATVDVADGEGWTPLMRAAYRGHEETVRCLVNANANVYLQNCMGRTALDIGRANNRHEAADLIEAHQQQHGGGNTSATAARAEGDAAALTSAASDVRKQADWFINRREIRRDREPFSSGSFGKVYRGWWLDSRVVVKCVAVNSEADKRTFHREARIWKKAQHPNIVQFYGACDVGSPYFFICEEASNGNLPDYLYRQKNEGRSLVWRKLKEAALGLHFLHERGIVHSDLKCNQILVSKDGLAMLTDFGLSFISAESRPEMETVGAVRWKAPECLQRTDRSPPTVESDLYSFGMCIVEAVTGEMPWQDLPDAVVIFYLVRRKEFLVRPAAFKDDAQWELVKSLCAFNPSERIKLSDAIKQLDAFALEELIQERMQEEHAASSDELALDMPTQFHQLEGARSREMSAHGELVQRLEHELESRRLGEAELRLVVAKVRADSCRLEAELAVAERKVRQLCEQQETECGASAKRDAGILSMREEHERQLQVVRDNNETLREETQQLKAKLSISRARWEDMKLQKDQLAAKNDEICLRATTQATEISRLSALVASKQQDVESATLRAQLLSEELSAAREQQTAAQARCQTLTRDVEHALLTRNRVLRWKQTRLDRWARHSLIHESFFALKADSLQEKARSATEIATRNESARSRLYQIEQELLQRCLQSKGQLQVARQTCFNELKRVQQFRDEICHTELPKLLERVDTQRERFEMTRQDVDGRVQRMLEKHEAKRIRSKHRQQVMLGVLAYSRRREFLRRTFDGWKDSYLRGVVGQATHAAMVSQPPQRTQQRPKADFEPRNDLSQSWAMPAAIRPIPSDHYARANLSGATIVPSDAVWRKWRRIDAIGTSKPHTRNALGK